MTKSSFSFFLWHFKIAPVYDLSYLTSAFFFWIARTIIWFCWRDISSWIKMKIAADCLLLFFSWGAIRFEKECSHWKFNIWSKFRLHNVQSFQDSSDAFYHSTRWSKDLLHFARYKLKARITLCRIYSRYGLKNSRK